MGAKPRRLAQPGEIRFFGSMAILAWSAVAAAVVAAGSATSLGAVVVVPFVLFAPGTALVLALGLNEVALGATVVILTGIATSVLVPSILLYTHAWSPKTAFAIILVATVAIVGAERSLYGVPAGIASSYRARPRGGVQVRERHLLRISAVTGGVALVLWAASLGSIDPTRSSDVGLISALPATYFASLILLTASFAIALASREVVPLLWLQIGVLVVVLFGTPSLVEYGPRTQSAWRLAGIADSITQQHSIDRSIDAFFNWPGFFVLVSFVTQAAGMSTPLALARWAPLFFNLAYAVPLFVIFRGLALSRRQVWIGLWLFFVGNWVSQDYLAPQAFGYLIYLSIIATIVAFFPGKQPSPMAEGNPALPSPRARVAIAGFLLLLYALVVPSHQLSPWLIMISVAFLVLVGRLPFRWFPLVMTVMAAAWVIYGAAPYLKGHFGTVAAPVGSVGSNVHQNLGSRLEGNAGHLFVVRLRSLYSVAIGVLAVLGALRLRRSGASLRTIGLLAFAPFLALGAQTYGGELLLRTYFFSLPFLALAGAAALAPTFGRSGIVRRVAATALLVAAGIVFVVARYGNEKMDAYTKQEVAAVRFLFAKAPAGAVVVSADDNLPWKYEHYADYRYHNLEDATRIHASIKEAVRAMRADPRTSYLILTRSQAAQGELFSGWKSDTLSRLRAAVIRSGRFRIVFRNRDSTLFTLRPQALHGREG